MIDNTQELDEILTEYATRYFQLLRTNAPRELEEAKRIEAKQAITSLIKELVAEAKPEVPEEYERDDALYIGFERGREYYYDAISNLLKALEEK